MINKHTINFEVEDHSQRNEEVNKTKLDIQVAISNGTLYIASSQKAAENVGFLFAAS